MNSRRRFIAKLLLGSLLVASTPTFAWYYFTSSSGQRTQWVFGSSCNASGSRPITMIYDSDIPGAYAGNITAIMADWNSAAGGTNIVCPAATCNPSSGTYQRTMTTSVVSSFTANPTANQIWIVWDTDGSVLRSIGVDPTSSVLGIGTGLTMNTARPQDTCAGILFLNASSITTANTFQRVLIHELGHVLGLAHSIASNNQPSGGAVTAVSGGNLPVMFPFLYSNSPLLANEDDKAGMRTMYGP